MCQAVTLITILKGESMMSEKGKMSILDKEMTRRRFLELTGMGAAGLAASTGLLSLFNLTKAEAESGAVSVIATADGVLVSNAARCTGCQRCEMNCSLINNGKVMPYIARVKVARNLFHGNDGETGGLFGSFDYKPDTCHQCADPACLKACPMGAISVRESDGTRVVDKDKCIGCGACERACPFHMITVDPEEKKSNKCILCGYCAQECPCGALTVAKWEDVAEAMGA